jgi:hypothetical protein
MSIDERNRNGKLEIEDAQVEMALKRFRESVRVWSDEEFSRARVIRKSRWDGMWRMMANPVMAWSMACVLTVASVGVPVNIHHRQVVAAERRAELEKQKRLAEEKAQQQAAAAAIHENGISDDELMSHVDSDIAQDAPDAMQPLAQLMSDSATR